MNHSMNQTSTLLSCQTRYLVFIFLLILLTAYLQLGILLITSFFAYFILKKMPFRHPWIAVTVFFISMIAILYVFAFFINQAYKVLPEIISTSIPLFIQYAQQHGIHLPFSDWASMKDLVIEGIKDQLHYVGNVAHWTIKQTVFFIIATVVASSIFMSRKSIRQEVDAEPPHDNLYLTTSRELFHFFHLLNRSFQTVIGAQIIISIINTVITALFAYEVHLPHPMLVIFITFFCGLLPVVGNLVSNTVIICIGFTVSPQLAFYSLIFLVVVHKLEYFLNSKIIGGRIENPFWLTLIGLVVGERILGITGIIFAPVVLHFIKVVMSKPLTTDSHK